MSASTTRCLTSGNSYKNMQMATCSNKKHFAGVDESEQKRAPVKSNGKHLRQRREMRFIGERVEGFGETRR